MKFDRVPPIRITPGFVQPLRQPPTMLLVRRTLGVPEVRASLLVLLWILIPRCESLRLLLDSSLAPLVMGKASTIMDTSRQRKRPEENNKEM